LRVYVVLVVESFEVRATDSPKNVNLPVTGERVTVNIRETLGREPEDQL